MQQSLITPSRVRVAGLASGGGGGGEHPGPLPPLATTSGAEHSKHSFGVDAAAAKAGSSRACSRSRSRSRGGAASDPDTAQQRPGKRARSRLGNQSQQKDHTGQLEFRSSSSGKLAPTPTAAGSAARRQRRPWRAGPPALAAPLFIPRRVRSPCLNDRGRYYVSCFRRELQEEGGEAARRQMPALLAPYAAELAWEEPFAAPATPAAYPRLNLRGRQYVAAFRRELLGRRVLAGEVEELVQEYAAELELEAAFAVAGC